MSSAINLLGSFEAVFQWRLYLCEKTSYFTNKTLRSAKIIPKGTFIPMFVYAFLNSGTGCCLHYGGMADRCPKHMAIPCRTVLPALATTHRVHGYPQPSMWLSKPCLNPTETKPGIIRTLVCGADYPSLPDTWAASLRPSGHTSSTTISTHTAMGRRSPMSRAPLPLCWRASWLLGNSQLSLPSPKPISAAHAAAWRLTESAVVCLPWHPSGCHVFF